MTVPVVPGYPVHSVTGNGQNDVTRQYRRPIPRAGTHRRPRTVTIAPRMDWNAHGILAVVAVAALAVLADGGALLLIAWLRS